MSSFFYPLTTIKLRKGILGNNSIAIVFTGDYDFVRAKKKLSIIGWNNETNAVEAPTIERYYHSTQCLPMDIDVCYGSVGAQS
ncbi:hypothetical protein V3C99_004086 [Haemonchus contortus]|uniref:Peptidase_C25 domain-containing protein n=1 Tax=Haemonchus contortus TaxID=6289 RepID=A0A7I4XZ40_HAECO